MNVFLSPISGVGKIIRFDHNLLSDFGDKKKTASV
jgi:hypothetical protein